MTITAAEVKGEYVLVSSVKQLNYTVAIGRTITLTATATGAGTAAPVIT